MISFFHYRKTRSIKLFIVFISLFSLFICFRTVDAEEKKPIYVQFFTHQQYTPIRTDLSRPSPYSIYAKELIDVWEKYGIKGEYSTLGINMQTLLEDFPETVEKIKQMRIRVKPMYSGTGPGGSL